MANYYGTASYFCVDPDTCSCNNTCCCQGSNCSSSCTSSTACGVGSCCTCRSNYHQYAWKNPGCPSCCNAGQYNSLACGESSQFSKDNVNFVAGVKCDVGPSACHMVDLTKSLFTYFAPLSQGTVNLYVQTQ